MDAPELKGLDTQSIYYIDRMLISLSHGKPTYCPYNWLSHLLAVYNQPCEVVKAIDKFGFYVTDLNRIPKA